VSRRVGAVGPAAVAVALLGAAGVGAQTRPNLPPAPAPRAPVPPQSEAPTPVVPSIALPRVVVIATTEGPFAEFDDPAASSSGAVVFHARRDDLREGIYLSTSGVPAPVAETGSAITDGNQTWHVKRLGRAPTVNHTSVVAFTVELAEGGRAVLVAQPGGASKFQFVADSGEAFRDFGDFAAVNESANVAFRATLDPPGHPDRADFNPRRVRDPTLLAKPDDLPARERMTFAGRKKDYDAGLFVDRTHDLLTVATTEKLYLDVLDGFAFNDANEVAFRASRSVQNWSLLLDLGGGGSPRVLAETGARFRSFELPSIDARGRVAFVAHSADGSTAVLRSSPAGGLPEVVADASGGFTAFGPNVAIDESGRVAFVAQRREAPDRVVEALFLAADKDHVEPLLRVGELVTRHKVAHLRVGSRAFVRAEHLVVLAQLEPDLEALLAVYPGR
jgi:hypothetical protein